MEDPKFSMLPLYRSSKPCEAATKIEKIKQEITLSNFAKDQLHHTSILPKSARIDIEIEELDLAYLFA